MASVITAMITFFVMLIFHLFSLKKGLDLQKRIYIKNGIIVDGKKIYLVDLSKELH